VSKELAAYVQSNPHIEEYLPANTRRLDKGVYQFGNKTIHMTVINREVMGKSLNPKLGLPS
jgi:hypothetical protein